MKKLIFSLMMFCMMLMNNGVVWADLYMPPTSPVVDALLPVVFMILIMLFTILGISTVCILIGKIRNETQLLEKAKKLAEPSFYIVLNLILTLLFYGLFGITIFFMIFLIPILISLVLRKISIKKSYEILSIYILLINPLIFILILAIYSNKNKDKDENKKEDNNNNNNKFI